MILLTTALALALALALVQAVVLPARLLRMLRDEQARRDTGIPCAPRPPPEPAAPDMAALVAALRVVAEALDRHGVELPGSSRSFGEDDHRAVASPRPPDTTPSSRERPLPLGIDPPGSAPALPSQPAIVAARLGPRPDPTASLRRTEVRNPGERVHGPGGASPRPARPRVATLAGMAPVRALPRTMPSMAALGGAGPGTTPPTPAAPEPEGQASLEIWPPRRGAS